jgi:hypothetical protein
MNVRPLVVLRDEPASTLSEGGFMRAYVLIQADVAADGDGLTDELGRIPGVHGAERVSGPYDVIAEVGSDPVEFHEVVARISAMDGVLRALISPVVEGPVAVSENAA